MNKKEEKAMEEYAITMEGYTKRYKEFAIDGMNLRIPKGCITGFIGRNGAGKTTVFKGLLNMIRYEGDVRVLGLDSRTQEDEIKSRIGVVLAEDGFPEGIRLREMARIIRPFYSGWRDDTFQSLAGRFGLDLEKKVSALSRGMRVKLALALAMSHGAELLLLDEPTAGLDPLVREEILDLFMDLIQDENRTVFFSTHITSDLDKVADYIVLIEQGRIVLNQPKDLLLESHLLIQGGLESLERCRHALAGWKTNSFGFEGLARREALEDPELFRTEKPNVEQVMSYYIRGMQDENH